MQKNQGIVLVTGLCGRTRRLVRGQAANTEAVQTAVQG